MKTATITLKLSEKRGRFKAVLSAPGQKTETYTYGTAEEMQERAHAALKAATDLMLAGKLTQITTFTKSEAIASAA